jgi:hypothetical protein
VKKRGYSGGKKASQVGPPDQPKRCKSKARNLGFRCIKERGHEQREIDVVHQAGMFIWRDEPIRMNVRQPDRDTARGISASRGILDETVTLSDMRGHHATEVAVGEVSEPMTSWRSKAIQAMHDPERTTKLPPLETELRDWWLGLAQTEVDRTVPKAVEYGSTDLTDIGHDLARTMGREVTDEEAAELGVFFYLRGKVARWVSAVMDGRRVSDDTLFDIGVYVRMAQRIRTAGGWPDSTKQTGV